MIILLAVFIYIFWYDDVLYNDFFLFELFLSLSFPFLCMFFEAFWLMELLGFCNDQRKTSYSGC